MRHRKYLQTDASESRNVHKCSFYLRKVTLHTTYGTTVSILRVSAQRAAAKAATDSESFMIYGIFAVHTLQDRSRFFFVDCLQKRYSIAKNSFSNYVSISFIFIAKLSLVFDIRKFI